MIKRLALIPFLCCLSFYSASNPDFYGKLLISLESQDLYDKTRTKLVSNSSRIGLKDNFIFNQNLKFTYQLEYSFDPIDGKADNKKNKTFKQRNTFLGLEGKYGILFMGTHDTALKKSQFDIDLFNDLSSDITNILYGENRVRDFIGFTSKTSQKGLYVSVNAFKGNSPDKRSFGDAKSFSLNYIKEGVKMSLSKDLDVNGLNTERLSISMPISTAQIGLIYQNTKDPLTGSSDNGYIISIDRKFNQNNSFKVQIGRSNMKLDSGKQVTLGYDYKIKNNLKMFFFYTDLSSMQKSMEKRISSLGMEYKF